MKASGKFIECNGLLRVEDEEREELVAELKELTRYTTLQDIELGTEIYSSLLNGERPVACLLGSVFYAGAVMGKRAERAKRAEKGQAKGMNKATAEEAQELIKSASNGVKEILDYYTTLPTGERETLLKILTLCQIKRADAFNLGLLYV